MHNEYKTYIFHKTTTQHFLVPSVFSTQHFISQVTFKESQHNV